MRRASWLLLRRVGAGMLVAHVGGAGLFALAVAVEAAEEPVPRLLATIAARVPEVWGRAAAVLSLLGAALAAFRLRRDGGVLGLGACGVAPASVIWVAALLGLLAGAAVLGTTGASEADPEWARGRGGWWHEGVAWPDVPGGAVAPPRAVERAPAAALASGAAAAALGGGLGLYAGPFAALLLAASLLISEGLCRGLCERGALPDAATLLPAAGALLALAWLRARAPLFPRRWG